MSSFNLKLITLLLLLLISCGKSKKEVDQPTDKSNSSATTLKEETHYYPTEGLVAAFNIDGKDSIYGKMIDNHNKIKKSAVYLNGHNQSIKVSNNPNTSPNGEFSISLWLKPSEFEGEGFRAILNKALNNEGQSPYYQYQVGIYGKDASIKHAIHFIVSLDDKIETIITEREIWIPEEWTHIAAIYDGLYIKLYINGVLSGNRAVSGELNNSDMDLLIGEHALLKKYTPGAFDEILFYNRALSAKEIDDIYYN